MYGDIMNVGVLQSEQDLKMYVSFILYRCRTVEYIFMWATLCGALRDEQSP